VAVSLQPHRRIYFENTQEPAILGIPSFFLFKSKDTQRLDGFSERSKMDDSDLEDWLT
jgi:hypothetical protein